MALSLNAGPFRTDPYSCPITQRKLLSLDREIFIFRSEIFTNVGAGQPQY